MYVYVYIYISVCMYIYIYTYMYMNRYSVCVYERTCILYGWGELVNIKKTWQMALFPP